MCFLSSLYLSRTSQDSLEHSTCSSHIMTSMCLGLVGLLISSLQVGHFVAVDSFACSLCWARQEEQITCDSLHMNASELSYCNSKQMVHSADKRSYAI